MSPWLYWASVFMIWVLAASAAALLGVLVWSVVEMLRLGKARRK